MSIPLLIPIITKASPILASYLTGSASSLVASLISKVLGVDMSKPEEVAKKLEEDPTCAEKLKDLELQISDLQNARIEASKDTGYLRMVRPVLAVVAMLAIFIDILLITYVVKDILVEQILVLMAVFLVWDVRQIYKFYFGSIEEIPSFLYKKNK